MRSAALIDALAKDRGWQSRKNSFQFQLEAISGVLEEIEPERFAFAAGEGSIHAFNAGFPAAGRHSGQWMYELVIEKPPVVGLEGGSEYDAGSSASTSYYSDDGGRSNMAQGGSYYSEAALCIAKFSVGWEAYVPQDPTSASPGGNMSLSEFCHSTKQILGHSEQSFGLGADGMFRQPGFSNYVSPSHRVFDAGSSATLSAHNGAVQIALSTSTST